MSIGIDPIARGLAQEAKQQALDKKIVSDNTLSGDGDASSSLSVIGIREVNLNTIVNIWSGSEDEYNAITNKNEHTIYFISEEE